MEYVVATAVDLIARYEEKLETHAHDSREHLENLPEIARWRCSA